MTSKCVPRVVNGSSVHEMAGTPDGSRIGLAPRKAIAWMTACRWAPLKKSRAAEAVSIENVKTVPERVDL